MGTQGGEAYSAHHELNPQFQVLRSDSDFLGLAHRLRQAWRLGSSGHGHPAGQSTRTSSTPAHPVSTPTVVLFFVPILLGAANDAVHNGRGQQGLSPWTPSGQTPESCFPANRGSSSLLPKEHFFPEFLPQSLRPWQVQRQTNRREGRCL